MKKRAVLICAMVISLVGIGFYIFSVNYFSTESSDKNWKLICCQSEGSPQKLWEGFLVYQGEDIDEINSVSVDMIIDGNTQREMLEVSDYSPSIRYQMAIRIKSKKIFRFVDYTDKPQKISGEIQWSIGGNVKKTTVEYDEK